MNATRWFWGVSAVLSINVLLVAASGIRAHMRPQDDSPNSTLKNQAETESQDLALPATPQQTQPTEVADRPSFDLGVPSVPSLEEVPGEALAGVPGDVKNDPVYQELKKMFSESGGSFESPPLIDTPSNSSLVESTGRARNNANSIPSPAYFARLDHRLESATQLCETARSVAAEAALSAEAGDGQAAAELLQMATQLREMAANLISRQL